jgi:hypothetical protein
LLRPGMPAGSRNEVFPAVPGQCLPAPESAVVGERPLEGEVLGRSPSAGALSSAFIAHFSSFKVTHGSFAGAIILLVWL